MITKDNIIDLFKKIHMLDIDTREIIYLKIIRNFTFKEISQILGRNEEWARTKFYRGKLKLKEIYMKEDAVPLTNNTELMTRINTICNN